MTRRILLGLRAVALLLLVGLALPLSAHAQEPPVGGVVTRLTYEQPAPVELGAGGVLTARLTTPLGGEPTGQRIDLLENGVAISRGSTSDGGYAEVPIPVNLSAGTHRLVLRYLGSPEKLRPTATRVSFVVREGLLEVQTVPAVGGVAFQLDDQRFTSGVDGTARVAVQRYGDHRLQVSETKRPDLETAFQRWGDNASLNEQVFQAARTISLRGSRRIQVALNVKYPVTATFTDPADKPVDPSRIQSISLEGSEGSSVRLTGRQPWLLQSSRPSRPTEGLEARPISYSVEQVQIDGVNVVNRGAQRFEVQPGKPWEIELLLYTIGVQSSDAIFGFPLGTGVELEYPNGRVQTGTLSEDGTWSQPQLARGQYKVRVTGAPGMAPVSPLALSRNLTGEETVALKVISYVDMLLVLLFGAAIALGLLFYGRRSLLRSILTARPPTPAVVGAGARRVGRSAYLSGVASVSAPIEAVRSRSIAARMPRRARPVDAGSRADATPTGVVERAEAVATGDAPAAEAAPPVAGPAPTPAAASAGESVARSVATEREQEAPYALCPFLAPSLSAYGEYKCRSEGTPATVDFTYAASHCTTARHTNCFRYRVRAGHDGHAGQGGRPASGDGPRNRKAS